ncbi:MAG: hypothetical protein U0350_07685 [Caldilineaceae bacterium]
MAAAAFCLVVGLLCLSKFVYALDPATSSQEVAQRLANVEKRHANNPQVPTVPTLPPGTPTSTATPTATPSGVNVVVDTNSSTNGRQLGYTVTFNNTTGGLIKGAKAYFTVPQYTTFNLGASQAGWSCPNGVTAGNICVYVWGDVSPGAAAVLAAHANASRQADFVLDVLVDQVPANVTSISFDIYIADSTGKIYTTFTATSALSSNPTFMRFLPLIRQ